MTMRYPLGSCGHDKIPLPPLADLYAERSFSAPTGFVWTQIESDDPMWRVPGNDVEKFHGYKTRMTCVTCGEAHEWRAVGPRSAPLTTIAMTPKLMRITDYHCPDAVVVNLSPKPPVSATS